MFNRLEAPGSGIVGTLRLGQSTILLKQANRMGGRLWLVIVFYQLSFDVK